MLAGLHAVLSDSRTTLASRRIVGDSAKVPFV